MWMPEVPIVSNSCGPTIHHHVDSNEFLGPRQGSGFRHFFGFFDFWDFLDFGVKNGPKRAREGFQRVRGGIPLHLDKVSAQMGPFGAHSGPFLFFNFPKPILGPNSSKSIIPNEVLGPWGPGWGERAAPGGRRPTFRRGVGGRSPPTATRGVWGGGSPPTEKGPLELLQIAKSETLRNC